MGVYRQLAYIEENTSLVSITRINDEVKSKVRIRLELINLHSKVQGRVRVAPIKTAQKYVQSPLYLYMSQKFNNLTLKVLAGEPLSSSFFLTRIFKSLQSKGIAQFHP